MSCIKLAVICGFFLDLISSHLPLGFYSLSNLVVIEVIYPLRRHFFPDRWITLPVLAGLFSFISIFLQTTLSVFIGYPFVLSFHWMGHHLLFIPLLNTLYCFLLFVYPSALLNQKRLV